MRPPAKLYLSPNMRRPRPRRPEAAPSTGSPLTNCQLLLPVTTSCQLLTLPVTTTCLPNLVQMSNPRRRRLLHQLLRRPNEAATTSVETKNARRNLAQRQTVTRQRQQQRAVSRVVPRQSRHSGVSEKRRWNKA